MTRYQSSVLFVRDMAASRRFYEELLGQQVLMDHGANVGFVGGFAIWQGDYATQTVFGQPPAEAAPWGRRNLELYFEADDPVSVWSRLAEVGVQAVHEVREQPWGQRVLRVYDPDGHVVEVGEPMYVTVRRFMQGGLNVEAVAERTSMPLAIVQQIAAGNSQSGNG